MSRIDKLKTIVRLGLQNVARVGIYRVKLKAGLHGSQRIEASMPNGPFFHIPTGSSQFAGLSARQDWTPGWIQAFGRPLAVSFGASGLPDWHGPLGAPIDDNSATQPWWKLTDFDPQIGDIKRVWELSRFDWVLVMAQHAALGDESELVRLNKWLADWCRSNPSFNGRNWKCGQEASIRVLHLAAATLILNQSSDAELELKSLVQIHLQRIEPTIGYAIGQSNNHGTSEAAALFVGGILIGGEKGQRWQKLGLKWLSERALNLIERDGTFSQYSVNYHRLMLDTYAFCTIWQRLFNVAPFGNEVKSRLTMAVGWLEHVTDPSSGDVPTLGANDGAYILNLTNCGYRDYRPSVQLASALFRGTRAYSEGPWDQQLRWFAIDIPKQTAMPLSSVSLDDGGLHVLRSAPWVVFLRYPRFRFRPSQADSLHCDVWMDGQNVLRDAGTFSYNSSKSDTQYFNGTEAHNTVQFDDRDQMPRYSRFLFGSWLSARQIVPVTQTSEAIQATAGYVDYAGASHTRSVSVLPAGIVVEDYIADFQAKAILRWRLYPGDWQLCGYTATNGVMSLQLTADVDIESMRLVDGQESRYYLDKHSIPVLEIECLHPGKLTTHVTCVK